MNLSCVSNLFCEVYIYTHPTIIDVKIDWFKVNRFTLHLSKQKARLVRGYNMHEEFE